ncbi:MAG TPA: carboxypeptidase-like regulatory domain-containing protein, partial [Chitinophagaceae bacterium]|nr:carboxypeptidase-like regulatory domain-containing protein [Chitinophagaceae bacterium]
MKEAIRIQLTSPCHENWQAMTPNEQGRYCQSCCKTVVDFTAMTDLEIVDYIAYSAAGNTCARVYDDQLDRVIQKPRERKTWKYFWSLAIASLVLSYRSIAQVKAPKNKVVNMGVNPDKKKMPMRIGGISSEPAVPVDIEMHGRVVNESGAPVPFATVTLTHPYKMIATDSAGRYSFITNELEKFEWSVSSAGYEAAPAAKLDV